MSSRGVNMDESPYLNLLIPNLFIDDDAGKQKNANGFIICLFFQY